MAWWFVFAGEGCWEAEVIDGCWLMVVVVVVMFGEEEGGESSVLVEAARGVSTYKLMDEVRGLAPSSVVGRSSRRQQLASVRSKRAKSALWFGECKSKRLGC